MSRSRPVSLPKLHVEAGLIAGRNGSGGVAGWVAGNPAVIDRALETADATLRGPHGPGGRRQSPGYGPTKALVPCSLASPPHPLLGARDVAAGLLGSSERSARTALAALAARVVLSPIGVPSPGPGRNRHWFIVRDLLELRHA